MGNTLMYDGTVNGCPKGQYLFTGLWYTTFRHLAATVMPDGLCGAFCPVERMEVVYMRKTIFILISLAFTGGLLLYTAQANLDLLTQTYPNPKFVIFGMLALEGGVLYWTGAYLLHWTGTHKGIAVVMIAVDAIFSLTGFFIEMSNYNASHSYLGQIPSVVVIVAGDVALNVGMGIIIHLLPDDRNITKEDFRPLVNGAKSMAGKVKEAGSTLAQTMPALSKKDDTKTGG